MVKKKIKVKHIEKAIKGEKIIIGARKTIKLLKNNKLRKIILANDLEEGLKKEIKKLSEIFNVDLEESKKNRKEIAEELKKPFLIGCLGIIK